MFCWIVNHVGEYNRIYQIYFTKESHSQVTKRAFSWCLTTSYN